MRLAIDTKNLALYTGGIANFFRPLLGAWIVARPQHQFVLVGPPFDDRTLLAQPNVLRHVVSWPGFLPRQLRHPVYDNLLFPGALRSVRADFVFTPYHDVRLPRSVPSAMMIHDTCFDDLPWAYPTRIRTYYQYMLRRNIQRARHILTVSQASRSSVLRHYAIAPAQIEVVANTLDAAFLRAADGTSQLSADAGALRLLYPSGSEPRKNVPRMLSAMDLLVGRGHDVTLAATGARNGGWDEALGAVPQGCQQRVTFLGKLEASALAAEYLAANVIVYPTLCEGFGRVCLEAMELGVPLACSDLEVLREAAGDYPCYFNPLEPSSIADAILEAARQGRQPRRKDPRFQATKVASDFVAVMDNCLSYVLEAD